MLVLAVPKPRLDGNNESYASYCFYPEIEIDEEENHTNISLWFVIGKINII